MIDWLYMLIDIPANENMSEYFKFNEGFAYTMYCTHYKSVSTYLKIRTFIFAESELWQFSIGAPWTLTF